MYIYICIDWHLLADTKCLINPALLNLKQKFKALTARPLQQEAHTRNDSDTWADDSDFLGWTVQRTSGGGWGPKGGRAKGPRLVGYGVWLGTWRWGGCRLPPFSSEKCVLKICRLIRMSTFFMILANNNLAGYLSLDPWTIFWLVVLTYFYKPKQKQNTIRVWVHTYCQQTVVGEHPNKDYAATIFPMFTRVPGIWPKTIWVCPKIGGTQKPLVFPCCPTKKDHL